MMNRRKYERINSNVPVSFFHENALYEGNVTNLSESGMHIETGAHLPVDSKFELLLQYKSQLEFLFTIDEDSFNIPVEVRRIRKTDCLDCMAVELVKPPEDLLDFIKHQRTLYGADMNQQGGHY